MYILISPYCFTVVAGIDVLCPTRWPSRQGFFYGYGRRFAIPIVESRNSGLVVGWVRRDRVSPHGVARFARMPDAATFAAELQLSWVSPAY